MTVKEIAIRMMDVNSHERLEAEKMMGKPFEDMTPAQRIVAAECLAAFAGLW